MWLLAIWRVINSVFVSVCEIVEVSPPNQCVRRLRLLMGHVCAVAVTSKSLKPCQSGAVYKQKSEELPAFDAQLASLQEDESRQISDLHAAVVHETRLMAQAFH